MTSSTHGPQSCCNECGLLAMSSPLLVSSFLLCRLGVPGRFIQDLKRTVHDMQSHIVCLKAIPSTEVGKELMWVTSWESTWPKRIVVGFHRVTQGRKVSLYSQDQCYAHVCSVVCWRDRFVLHDHCRFIFLCFGIITRVLMTVKGIAHISAFLLSSQKYWSSSNSSKNQQWYLQQIIWEYLTRCHS